MPKLFNNLDKPKEVFAWGLYDLANQSFTLLIITLLFPIYFKTVAVGDEQRGDSLWSIGVSAALLTVVLLSPFVGSYADARAKRIRGFEAELNSKPTHFDVPNVSDVRNRGGVVVMLRSFVRSFVRLFAVLVIG